MRRFYSLLLTAAFLLVGMNVLAVENHVQVVNHTTPAKSGEYTSLQDAIDHVLPGDTADLTLLGDQVLTEIVQIPHFTGDTANWNYQGEDPNVQIGEKPIRVREGQRIRLDLNGNTIKEKEDLPNGIGCIAVCKGTLHITGTGEIQHNHAEAVSNDNIKKSAITLFGAPWAFKQTVWTTLYVDENVFINAKGSGKNYGICIQNTSAKCSMMEPAKAGYNTYETNKSIFETYACHKTSNAGCAYGIRAYIKGQVFGNQRGINVLGTINAAPDCDENWTEKTRRYPDPAAVSKPFYYNNFYPYIKIYPTAQVWCYNETLESGNGGIYGGGYCVYDISGNVHGQTGIFLKAGDAILNGATVGSDSENSQSGANYGDSNAGTAIYIASDAGYAGDVKVVLTAETKVTGGGEAAIVDMTATNMVQGQEVQTNVTHLEIQQGVTIEAGANGAIELTNKTGTQKTTVTGGTINGTLTVGGTQQSVATLVPQDNNHHVVTIVDGNETIYVVSEGQAPSEVEGNSVIGAAANASISWKNSTTKEETLTANKKLTELQISQDYAQKLTVADGVTLEVGRVVLGTKAQIVVEAGGKFIVSGEQGIATVRESNIVLKTQENKPAIFLIHPSITYNRTPAATVEFTSKSFYTPEGYVFQRFGLPTVKDGLEGVSGADNPRTRFWSFDYSNNSWKALGFINGTGSDVALDITKMNDPFEYYQMMNFGATNPDGVVYTFTGNLLGNREPVMQILANSWKGFANSYMGIMQLSELLKLIPNTVDKAIYTYNVDAVHGSWEPVTNLNSAGAKLNPMQPFLIRNRYDAAEVALNYTTTVYNPTMGIVPNGAPSRAAANNITMAKITIANENSTDYVIVAEDNEFTPSFDNGYDASKYMNDEVNLYVEAEENMSIFATDNLENTTLGVSSVLGGTYTITFSNVSGDNFVLVDNMTGAQTAMNEGNSYEFNVAANTVNSHRFVILPIAKVPTAIENTAVKAHAKGVYSLMGQYLGDKIEVLPAGVYVVNGVKIVK